MLCCDFPALLHLDTVSGSKPSPYDPDEDLESAKDQVDPLPYPNDFGTMPSEAMNVFPEHDDKDYFLF